jgi:hypothetical protein
LKQGPAHQRELLLTRLEFCRGELKFKPSHPGNAIGLPIGQSLRATR